MRYFFILGNNRALSSAEITSVLGDSSIDELIISPSNDFLIIHTKKEIDVESLINVLGGTIKIGIVEEGCDIESKNINFNFLIKKILSFISGDKEKKYYFGFSFYGEVANDKVKNFFTNQTKRLGMEMKNRLKKLGISSRWVIGKEKILSSVIVKKNKLTSDQGNEWCFLQAGDKVYLGKTLAVQDFEEFGSRDFGRPARDSLSGMLPPKLARLMVNLGNQGEVIKDKVLLDPFCGSGTVLQEALLLGFKKLIGTDLSQKAVDDSITNLQWLEQKKGLKGDISISVQDVKKLSDNIDKNSIDLIITEPYLGPPLRGGESDKDIDQIIQELGDLYLSAIGQFEKVLKKDGRICIVWPVFALHGQIRYLPILEQVNKIGFNLVDLSVYKKTSDQVDQRGALIYKRPNQLVWREVLVFER